MPKLKVPKANEDHVQVQPKDNSGKVMNVSVGGQANRSRKFIVTYYDTENGVYKLHRRNQSVQLQQGLASMRKDDVLCDVHLLVEGEAIRAHKVVLAAHSQYFLAMFTAGMVESEGKEIAIEGLTAAGVKAIVDVMYTGATRILKEHLQDVVVASDLFQLEELHDMASHLLAKHINAANCIGMISFGESHNSCEIKKKAEELWRKQFLNASQEEEFLELDVVHLKSLLDMNDLTLDNRGEDAVLDAILRWKRHDSRGRQDTFCHLIPILYVSALSGPKLLELKEFEEVTTSPVLQELIEKQQQLVSTRKMAVRHIYAIGGYLQSRTGPVCPKLSHVERMDPGIFRLAQEQLCDLPFVPSAIQAFNIAERLICFATDSLMTDCFGSIEVLEYSLIHNTWNSLAEDVVAVTVRQLIYAIFKDVGSFSYNSQTQKIYTCIPGKFVCIPVELEDGGDFVMESFSNLAAIPGTDEDCRRIDNVLVTAENQVYSLGGALKFSQTEVESTTDFFWYNSESDAWMPLPPMLSSRAKLCAAYLDSYIYAMGGFSHFRLNKCERYNLESKQWEEISPMSRYRSHASCGTVNDKIYICGGKSYANKVHAAGARKVEKTCECYEPKLNLWTLAGGMCKSRCQFTMAVV